MTTPTPPQRRSNSSPTVKAGRLNGGYPNIPAVTKHGAAHAYDLGSTAGPPPTRPHIAASDRTRVDRDRATPPPPEPLCPWRPVAALHARPSLDSERSGPSLTFMSLGTNPSEWDGRSDMTKVARRRFPREPESGHAARRWLREQCRSWLPGWRCDDLLLVTSELVTNAIRHGQGPIEVALMFVPPSLSVWVQDGGHEPVAMVDAGPESLHGRGLHIVARLSEEWGAGADASDRGNIVWAKFRVS